MKGWRSRAVALASVGAVGVLGCYSPEPAPESQPLEMRRHGYASVEACKQDYPLETCAIETDFADLSNCLVAKDRTVCEAERLASGTAYAWGPWHAVDPALAAPGDPGAGATAMQGVSQIAATSETTIRGGFGGTAETSSGMGCSGGGHSGG